MSIGNIGVEDGRESISVAGNVREELPLTEFPSAQLRSERSKHIARATTFAAAVIIAITVLKLLAVISLAAIVFNPIGLAALAGCAVIALLIVATVYYVRMREEQKKRGESTDTVQQLSLGVILPIALIGEWISKKRSSPLRSDNGASQQANDIQPAGVASSPRSDNRTSAHANVIQPAAVAATTELHIEVLDADTARRIEEDHPTIAEDDDSAKNPYNI